MHFGSNSPTKGNVVVCGKDVTQLNDEQRRFHRLSNIGIVFQDYPLIPYLNAIQNVLLPFRIHPKFTLTGTEYRICRTSIEQSWSFK